MNERGDILASLTLPSPDAAAACVQDARRLFERTISGWAVDALKLRKSGACDLHWQMSSSYRAGLPASRYRRAA